MTSQNEITLRSLATLVNSRFPGKLSLVVSKSDKYWLEIQPKDPAGVVVRVLAVDGTIWIFPGDLEGDDSSVDVPDDYEHALPWALECITRLGRFGAYSYRRRGIYRLLYGRQGFQPQSAQEIKSFEGRTDIKIITKWKPWQ